MSPSDEPNQSVTVEERGPVAVVKIDAGPLGLFGRDLLPSFAEAIRKIDETPYLKAAVITGTHPRRFVSHADVRWLQEGAADSPTVRGAAARTVVRLAESAGRRPALAALAKRTPLSGAVELNLLHATLTRMNSSGAVFAAALNGSALGLGAEIAWACDVRVMADDPDFFIGHPEILLGFAPGAGGTQRLTRLIGAHRSLLAILEAHPFTPAEAFEAGLVDELVAQSEVVERAIAICSHLGTRSKDAIAATKRAVYFGGSADLERGLAIERVEFLESLQQSEAQARMVDYLARTESDGELPLYQPSVLEDALEVGKLPANPVEGSR